MWSGRSATASSSRSHASSPSTRSLISVRYGRARLPWTYAVTRPGVTVIASTRPRPA